MAIPKLKTKHSAKSLIEPKDFIEYQKKRGRYKDFVAPDAMIFCYQKSIMDHILENHEITKVESPQGEMYLLNETDNQIAVIGRFGIGAPVASTLLEEMIAFGVKKFITMGTAASLQKDIKIGDLILCEKAIRDEGTSHHYLEDSRFAHPSRGLTDKLRKSFEEIGQEYRFGATWTTDAPYRETVEEARVYQEEGIATVEMEASALFAVAEYRGVDLATILTVTDTFANLDWHPKCNFKETEQSLETMYKIALKTCLS